MQRNVVSILRLLITVMTAPWICFKGLNFFCSYWIRMYVFDKRQKIFITVAEDRFVPALKQMTNCLVSPVEICCVSLVYSLHYL